MIAVRAPDHLGDAVMALPAIEALAALGPLSVYCSARWARELFEGLDLHGGDELPVAPEVAVCFKPSWHAAWRWRHLPTVGVGPAGRYKTTLPEAAEHRRERYARIVQAVGAPAPGVPVYRPRGAALVLPEGYVGFNPCSPSRTVRWPGFGALAERLAPHPIVTFCGPGEHRTARGAVGPHVKLVPGLGLRDFADALSHCTVLVSNDSGAAHFAAACGVPVVVVHGSTDPARTGVGTPVERPARLWCQPCYRKVCLWGTPCMDVSAEAVEAVVRTFLGRGASPG